MTYHPSEDSPLVIRRHHEAEQTRIRALLIGGPSRKYDRLQPVNTLVIDMLRALRLTSSPAAPQEQK